MSMVAVTYIDEDMLILVLMTRSMAVKMTVTMKMTVTVFVTMTASVTTPCDFLL